MKISSVEFREMVTLIKAELRTSTIFAESHDIELVDGWVRWRVKGGQWHRTPVSFVRNICEVSDEPVKLPVDNLHASVMQGDPENGLKRRGKREPR